MSALLQQQFARYERVLKSVGDGRPRLLIDLDLLDANLAELRVLRPAGQLRLVAKSLPSLELLDYIGVRLWGAGVAPRWMSFHLPFLWQLSRHRPEADILLGKPLPTAAVNEFYRRCRQEGHGHHGRLQWLADTTDRLLQLCRVAEQWGRRLTVNLELDVGMHRGGFPSPEALAAALDTLRCRCDHLRLGGFMGYDAHVARAPWPLHPRRAVAGVNARYQALLKFARAEFGDLEESPWCLNGAGSPSLALHGTDTALNDFSIGSALLKPADFDHPSLAGFRPATWIATPVLKRLHGIHLPFLEWLPNRQKDTVFLYGGRWMAQPAYPPTLTAHNLYGLSSNQQMMTVARESHLGVDDFVFFRPTQSESVLLQFGKLLAVRGESSVGEWAPLDSAA